MLLIALLYPNMKLQIDSKFKDRVDRTKHEIAVLRNRQEFLAQELAVELNVPYESPEYEILWDHIFNDTDWTVTYTDEN